MRQTKTPQNLARQLGGISSRSLFERFPSYNDLAASIADTDDARPTRQAVSARLNEDFHKLVESLLGGVIGMKINEDAPAGGLLSDSFREYGRVLVQDSSII